MHSVAWIMAVALFLVVLAGVTGSVLLFLAGLCMVGVAAITGWTTWR